MKQKLLVLAKSYKPNGRCIAGKLISKIENNTIYLSNWIRPIPLGGEPSAAVPTKYCTLSNNSSLQNLDIVEIEINNNANIKGQPENTFFNLTPWEKSSSLQANNICNLVEQPSDLWLESAEHTDFVNHSFILNNNISQSLYLIRVTNLKVTLSNEWDSYNQKYKLKIHASFKYGNIHYRNLSITCPALRKALKNKYPMAGQPDIEISLQKGDNYVLCVSLGPNISNQRHYKFVASVYDFDGYLQRNYNS